MERRVLRMRSMIKLLPLLLLAACVTEGNTVSGSWQPATREIYDGAGPGECHGDARINIVGPSPGVSDTVSCDDGGFALVIPLDVKQVVVEVRDDWSNTWTRKLDVDGNVDVGVITFSHF